MLIIMDFDILPIKFLLLMKLKCMHVKAHSLALLTVETLSCCSYFEPTTVLLHERLYADKLKLTRNCLRNFPLKEKIRKLIFMKAHNSLICRKNKLK